MSGKKTIFLKSAEEAEIIKANGQILGKCHAEVAKLVEPGITTKKLDQLAETFIKDHGGKPSFKGYGGFPSSLCISLNDVVVHGFPTERPLQDGDIVSIDCGVNKNGFHADSAYTYAVGSISDEVNELLVETKRSLYRAIEQVKPGNRIGDVSFAVQDYVTKLGYGIVRELVGHGVGKSLHEGPEVPNYGKRGKGPKMVAGMVIAIEPMITLGRRFVVQEKDGWTIRTEDRKPAAHYEHTVLVTESGYEILTTFDYIEQVLKEKELVAV